MDDASQCVSEMWTIATTTTPTLDKALKDERAVDYAGETSSMFSFFQMFFTIILRRRGSVLPFIFVEVVLALLLGVIAWALTPYGFCTAETCGIVFLEAGGSPEKGHAMIGVLLAFLVVFRSQIAWGMYWEGRAHVGSIIAKSRCLALELLASLSHAAVEEKLAERAATHMATGSMKGMAMGGAASGGSHAVERRTKSSVDPPTEQNFDNELALLALESVRLIKLFYWTVVEHVRSTDGEEPWRAANEMVQRMATNAENAEFDAEFGRVQAGHTRDPVIIPGTGDASDVDVKVHDPLAATVTYFRRHAAEGGNRPRFHDPTRAKPLVVITWLRINIERMVKEKAIETQQLQTISEMINGLVHAYNGVDKIDKTVLPLPYCQLLKIFQLFFVFSLPFVLAPNIAGWTPIVSVFTAIGFFGLDQVGVELEGPFGVEDNDFPLLKMGLGMCNDLDAMVRTVSRPRIEARLSSRSSAEREEMKLAAEKALAWADYKHAQ